MTYRPRALSGARWRKSSQSANAGGCVELAVLDQWIACRDSKAPEFPALLFPETSFQSFLAATKAR